MEHLLYMLLFKQYNDLILLFYYSTFSTIAVFSFSSERRLISYSPTLNSIIDRASRIGKIFGAATNNILIVDGFLDEKVLTEFAPLLAERVYIRLLTGQTKHKPSFPIAAAKWINQYGVKRPLEARLAEDKLLHDRLIFGN